MTDKPQRPGLTRIATTLYAFRDGERGAVLPVVHYGHEAIFLRGYMGPMYDLGSLQPLVSRGGRNMHDDPRP